MDELVTAEFRDLRSPLQDSVANVLQQESERGTTLGQDAGAGSAGAIANAVLLSLRKLLGASTCDNGKADDVPFMGARGVPVPEVDAELLPLQREVDAALQQLSALRRDVPRAVAATLQKQLALLRPEAPSAAEDLVQQAEAEGGEAAAATAPTPMNSDCSDQVAAAVHDAACSGVAVAAAAAAGAESGAAAADAQQLQAAMAAALDKLPALRARLQEVEARLARNVGALQAEDVRRKQSPRTVERVMAERTNRSTEKGGRRKERQGRQRDHQGEGGEAKGQEGLSGSAATKRRLARELAG